MDFLIATVYAPLSSWGEIAVGEVRDSWDRPSRSAVLGLIAAALGLERDARAQHEALDSGYGVAVRLDRQGLRMVDYHTVQTVPVATVRRAAPRTRAELLALGNLKTVESRRTYYQDSCSTLALWRRADGPWSLEQIAEAMQRPAFPLYAGRKSNPLGLPLAPEIVSAPTLADALRTRPSLPVGLPEHPERGRSAASVEVHHDPCVGFESGLRPLRQEFRRDGAPDRERWLFSRRLVEVGTMEEVRR